MSDNASNYRTGRDVRLGARSGSLTGPTSGLAPGFLQTNLVIVPESVANAFQAFCRMNPQPCPLLEMTRPGETSLRLLATDTDLRTDVPRYKVFIQGKVVEEPFSLEAHWREDFVAFLLGCSFTFEEVLQRTGIAVRHIDEGKNVSMFRTNIACKPSGPFRGNMVVSMRPVPEERIDEVTEISSRFPHAHGGPIQIGHPNAIGIDDLGCPDFGEAVTVKAGEVPVFWACGVTPQAALEGAKLEIAITHWPGCMCVCDVKGEEPIKIDTN